MSKYAVALWTGEWVGKQPKWQLITAYDTQLDALIGIRRTREIIKVTEETVFAEGIECYDDGRKASAKDC